jgi:hypothetical protein
MLYDLPRHSSGARDARDALEAEEYPNGTEEPPVLGAGGRTASRD